MIDDNEMQARLRETLAEHARRAPDGAGLAERIVLEAARRPSRARYRWRTWSLPIAAAGAVAALAAALVGIEHNRPTAGHAPPAAGVSSTSVQQPTPHSTTVAASPVPTHTAPAVHVVGVAHFQVVDLTFVGTHGWAWGTADCLSGQQQVCPAMVTTTDDGASWHSVSGPPANIPVLTCADPCVSNLRFASDTVGYAYGSSALFMTRNGGSSWQRLSGGAVALESLDGNVIRVESACVPGCPVTVQTAAVGSTTWETRTLPPGVPGFGVSLVRSGSDAYLLAFGHPAGGAPDGTSALFTSTDDGATWTSHAEPCPQQPAGTGVANGEVDSTAITAAPDGSVTVLCTPRGGAASFIATATGPGQTFRAAMGTVPSAFSPTAATSARVVLVVGDRLYRSTDGGLSWQAVGPAELGSARWLGFESATVGRAVGNTGSTIWTTRDGGASFSGFTFG